MTPPAILAQSVAPRPRPSFAAEATPDGRVALAVQDHQGRVRIWPAEHWRELARLWAGGAGRDAVAALFAGRGYADSDVAAMSLCLAASPHILAPIERALFVLAGGATRAEESGSFRLGERVVRAVDVVRMANRVLWAAGLPEIRYPGA